MKNAMKILSGLLLIVLAGCGDDKKTLVIYTTHGEKLTSEYARLFEQENPGVRVYAIDMGSQDALDRVRSEKVNPQASLWWGAPAPLFMQAAAEGLLEPYRPSWAAAVDSAYHDDEDMWYGTFLTPEVIAYNSEKLDSSSAPQDWDELLLPKWRGRIVIRDPLASGTMRAIFAAMIQRELRRTGSLEAGYDWLRKLDRNTASYTLNPNLLYIALARGETDVTLWNMPDIMLQRNENNYPFEFIIPAGGTVVVTDCMALIRNAKQPELAKKFYEFVTTQEALVHQAHTYYRIPARKDIARDKLPDWMQRPLKTMPMDWQLFAEKGNEWMQYWDDHIRGRGGK